MKVRVTDDEGKELAELRIDYIGLVSPSEARYSVQVVTDRGDAIGLHQRAVYYNFHLNNPLALVKLALDSLDPESFELEDEHPSPPDMARRQPRVVRALQAGASRLRDNRSTVRRGQPEQSKRDSRGEAVGEEDRQ